MLRHAPLANRTWWACFASLHNSIWQTFSSIRQIYSVSKGAKQASWWWKPNHAPDHFWFAATCCELWTASCLVRNPCLHLCNATDAKMLPQSWHQCQLCPSSCREQTCLTGNTLCKQARIAERLSPWCVSYHTMAKCLRCKWHIAERPWTTYLAPGRIWSIHIFIVIPSQFKGGPPLHGIPSLMYPDPSVIHNCDMPPPRRKQQHNQCILLQVAKTYSVFVKLRGMCWGIGFKGYLEHNILLHNCNMLCYPPPISQATQSSIHFAASFITMPPHPPSRRASLWRNVLIHGFRHHKWLSFTIRLWYDLAFPRPKQYNNQCILVQVSQTFSVCLNWRETYWGIVSDILKH